jgi:hypothetical protein
MKMRSVSEVKELIMSHRDELIQLLGYGVNHIVDVLPNMNGFGEIVCCIVVVY